MNSETLLKGGRTTPGVVRVGDTVRRPVTGGSTLGCQCLLHLQAVGFEGAPRFLGLDEQGRETLSFLPGDVPSDLGPFEDAQLATAAALLRRFHDATSTMAAVQERGLEVVCHNDWSPTNAVFRDGRPYALIDFDTAAPGLRLWDLGYSAFTWLDLGGPHYAAEEQVRRLELFARSYGHEDCSALQVAVFAVARQTALATSAAARGLGGLATWAADAAAWTVANITERWLPTGYAFPPTA